MLALDVARPELAVISQTTSAELARLVDRYLLVVRVSGRTGEEASRLVGVEGIRYVGNHGLERSPPNSQQAASPRSGTRSAWRSRTSG